MAGQNTTCVNCETDCRQCKSQSEKWKDYAATASRDVKATVDDIPGLRDALLQVVNSSVDDDIRYQVGKFL